VFDPQIGRLKVVGEFMELVPQRLGVDAQPFALHFAHLAGKWDMIEVLIQGHLDREIERISAGFSKL